MLVEMNTVAQAAKVAELTGGVHLATKPPKDGHMGMSRCVDVGDGFEPHRQTVESVSVLFKLYRRDGDDLTPVPSGWSATGAEFEVEWPREPERVSLIHSHFGARRKAYNWALAQVKADMDAKFEDPNHISVPWTLPALRKSWNQTKDDVAPWWAANSKEAYNSGIADLAKALDNWKKSKNATRKGRKIGFPTFRSKHHDAGRVRFTTGTMRFEDDRRTIVLPVIGQLRSKENTRRLQRPLSGGNARILNMTLSERWGRLFVSVNYAVRISTPHSVAKPGVRAGVDLGLRSLATVADTEGNIIEFANPAPLRATLSARREAGRQMSRRIVGSRGHTAAKTKSAKLDRRAVHIRQDAWHKLTTWLTATYSEVVIEDLDIAAMKRSMGRRAFRRAVSDTALGKLRPGITYKMQRAATSLIIADRWYPSSQIHHGCGCRLIAPTKLSKTLICATTGEMVDRDHNAAKNLRDWPELNASSGPVRSSAPVDTQAASDGGTDPGSEHKMTCVRRSDCKTEGKPEADCGEARIKTPQGDVA